jgi:hypothetical protein
MLNKHENQRKESRNVKISENITKCNADVIDYLEYYTTYPKTPHVKTIIEDENGGKITSERARKQ